MRRRISHRMAGSVGAGLLLAVAAAQADDVCMAPVRAAAPGGDQNIISITANRSESQARSQLSLEGGVELVHAQRLLQAERLRFDQKNGLIEARGAITLREGDFEIQGESVEINLRTATAHFGGGRYQVAGQPGRGAAGDLLIEGAQRITLRDASYTTCPPGDDTWFIRAGNIELKPFENEGSASHVRLEFMDVPFLYLPYINFPLGQRKTGLLVPNFGTSNTTGTEFELPFYWNIAPHRDATISPRYMSKRGTQLKTEFRYLNPRSAGVMTLEYLPEDRVNWEERALFGVEHVNYWSQWRGEVDYLQVSDVDYMRELGARRDEVSASVLPRSMGMSYADGGLWFEGRLSDFQLVDDVLTSQDHPYNRLPQLRLRTQQPLGSDWIFDFAGEFVHFDRNDSVTASRLDLEPGLAYRVEDSAGYLMPRIALRDTRYWLDGQKPGDDDRPARTLPLFTFDSGLWLERDWHIFNDLYRQTLEPRLFYLYVPYRRQEGMISDAAGPADMVFDSVEAEFHFDQMFATNRYTGADRMGDASQLTLALTSRLFDDRGSQRLRMRIGQTYYFSDRRVQLPGVAAEESHRSDVLLGLDGRVHEHWWADGLAQWSGDDDRLDKGNLRLAYDTETRHHADLALNYRRDITKQASLLVRWPLMRQWLLMGQWTHSFYEDRTLSAAAGVEYGDCCWSLRVAARHYISDNDGSTNTAIALQLELKGLANVGSNIAGFAEPKD